MTKETVFGTIEIKKPIKAKDELATLVRRLAKLKIKIECLGNYPFIYINKVNGKQVVELYSSEYGFVVAMNHWRTNDVVISDLKEVFKTIRKYL